MIYLYLYIAIIQIVFVFNLIELKMINKRSEEKTFQEEWNLSKEAPAWWPKHYFLQHQFFVFLFFFSENQVQCQKRDRVEEKSQATIWKMYTHVYRAISWNLASSQWQPEQMAICNALFERIALRLNFFIVSSPLPHLPVSEIAPFGFLYFVLMPICKV